MGHFRGMNIDFYSFALLKLHFVVSIILTYDLGLHISSVAFSSFLYTCMCLDTRAELSSHCIYIYLYKRAI